MISSRLEVMPYNNMLNSENTALQKTFYRQGMTPTILLTEPNYQQILLNFTVSCEEVEKNTETGDREIKKENQSEPIVGKETIKCQKKKDCQLKKNVKSSKSFNHNFQKHTVITIKKLGRKMCSHTRNSPVQAVVTQMWNIFQSSGITSKKILVVLFGAADFNETKNKQLFKSCYFGQICQFNDEIVRAAQNILRCRFLELTDIDLVRSHILRSRKITQRDQFIVYFNEFISMLRLGPLTKFRLNPETTHHIESIIREKKLSNLNVKKEEDIEYRTH